MIIALMIELCVLSDNNLAESDIAINSLWNLNGNINNYPLFLVKICITLLA